MSEKLYTIILKVDLQCVACTKKIKKTLTKLQDREGIRSVIYDEKNDSVIITGAFDPRKLIKKICCKACKVIKDIQIVEEKPKPPPPPPPPEPPAPEPAPPAPEPAPPAPEPAPPAPEPPPPAPEPPPPAPEPEPAPPAPEPEPSRVEPEPPQPEPVVKPPEPAYPYPTPAWTPGSGCCGCCRPWMEAHYGGCRCCSCGWIGPYRPVYCGPPQVVCDYKGPPYEYGGPCYGGTKTCEFICEEQPPSCGIM